MRSKMVASEDSTDHSNCKNTITSHADKTAVGQFQKDADTFEMQSQHLHSTHSSAGTTHPASRHAQASVAGQMDVMVQQRCGYACISSSVLHVADNIFVG